MVFILGVLSVGASASAQPVNCGLTPEMEGSTGLTSMTPQDYCFPFFLTGANTIVFELNGQLQVETIIKQ